MPGGAKKTICFSRLSAILGAWAALTGAAFVVSAAPASAFSDSATGFAVAAPEPFLIEKTDRGQFDVGVGIRSATGKPSVAGETKYLCETGFKSAPQNASLTREAINAMVEQAQWVNNARRAIEFVFRVDAQNYFRLQGYQGIEFHVRPKSGHAADTVRMTMSMVETPKGRVTFLCSTKTPEFNAALPTFRAIRAGVTLPE
ncbi:MAG: hypothetical protein ACRCXM_12750 [Beijerinckiaceae bacterium]